MLLIAKSCVDAIYCCQFNALSVVVPELSSPKLINKVQKLLVKSQSKYELYQHAYQQTEISLAAYEAKLIRLSRVLSKMRCQLSSEVVHA